MTNSPSPEEQEQRATEFSRKIDHYLRTASAAQASGDAVGAKYLRDTAEGYKETEAGLRSQAARLRAGVQKGPNLGTAQT